MIADSITFKLCHLSKGILSVLNVHPGVSCEYIFHLSADASICLGTIKLLIFAPEDDLLSIKLSTQSPTSLLRVFSQLAFSRLYCGILEELFLEIIENDFDM